MTRPHTRALSRRQSAPATYRDIATRRRCLYCRVRLRMYGWHQDGACSERILIRDRLPNGLYRTVTDPLDNAPPTWEVQVVVKYSQNGTKHLVPVAQYAPGKHDPQPPCAHRPSWVPESAVHEVWQED